MKKLLIMMVIFLFSKNTYAFKYNFIHSDNSKYEGKVIIQNVGSFYVKNGILELSNNQLSKVVGKNVFIPCSKKSNSTIVSLDLNNPLSGIVNKINGEIHIVLPKKVLYNKEYKKIKIKLKNEINKYKIYFDNSYSVFDIGKDFIYEPYVNKSNDLIIIITDEINFWSFNISKENFDKEIVVDVKISQNKLKQVKPIFNIELANSKKLSYNLSFEILKTLRINEVLRINDLYEKKTYNFDLKNLDTTNFFINGSYKLDVNSGRIVVQYTPPKGNLILRDSINLKEVNFYDNIKRERYNEKKVLINKSTKILILIYFILSGIIFMYIFLKKEIISLVLYIVEKNPNIYKNIKLFFIKINYWLFNTGYK